MWDAEMGLFLHLLKTDKNCDVLGVDISKEAVEKANAKGVKAITLDVERDELPFDDGYFDYVTCLEVLEHLRNPPLALEKMWRVTRGYGIFSYGNAAWWRNRLDLLRGVVPRNNPFKFGDALVLTKGHLQFWSFYEFKRLLKLGGFEPIEYKVLGNIPLIGRILSQDMNNTLVRFRPNLLGYGFVFLTEKSKKPKLEWNAIAHP